MIIAVLSLGQFISSKLDVLKAGFQSWFSRQEIEKTGDEVWAWMAKNLEPLRFGTISLETFCEQFNTDFDVKMDFATFKSIFNSMSTFDAATVAKLRQMKAFLDETDAVKVILVSHTNHSHLDYIMDQLEPIIPGCKRGILTAGDNPSVHDAQLFFATSMASKSVPHMGTLKFALEQLKIDLSSQLASFLRTIQETPDPAYTHFLFSEIGDDIERVIHEISALLRSGPGLTM